MNSKRVKAPVVVITREQRDEAMAILRQAKIEEQDLNSRLNAALDEARKPFTNQITEIELRIKNAFVLVQSWADANPLEFAKTKSIATQHGTLGYRTGNHAVETLKGFTIKRLIEFLSTRRALRKRYLRITATVNKEALIADRERLKPKTLAKMGIKIAQEETFFVNTEIKVTEATMKESQ